MAPVHVKDDYYRILGVSWTASHELIKESYKKLALQLHPDRNKSPNATASFQLLGQAWETLKDKDRRAVYDKECRLLQQKSAKIDNKRDTNSSTAPRRRKHRSRRRERHNPTTPPSQNHQKREPPSRASQPEYRERQPGNDPQPHPWDDRESRLQAPRPIMDHSAVIYLLKQRMNDMEDKMEELDRLDDEADDELESLSVWGLPWQDNWRVVHLEEQFEIRESQRRELVRELRAVWGKIQQFEEESDIGDPWF